MLIHAHRKLLSYRSDDGWYANCSQLCWRASSLARDEESALFFSPGDEVMCAYQVERLLTDQSLAERISDKARAVALIRNDPKMIIANQLEIYRQVIATG
jgi:hypothetical protein